MDLTFTHFVVIAALGMVCGSFVAALSYRLPRGQTVVRGRSKCPACSHILDWRDLVPIASWLVLRARCRYCNVSLSPRYPLIESVGAVAFIIATASSTSPFQLALLLAATSIFVTLAVVDVEHGELPKGLLLTLLGLAFAYRWFVVGDAMAGLLGAAIAFTAGSLYTPSVELSFR